MASGSIGLYEMWSLRMRAAGSIPGAFLKKGVVYRNTCIYSMAVLRWALGLETPPQPHGYPIVTLVRGREAS